jgi:glycosyltransferase involved in cell wall biosynthesis
MSADAQFSSSDAVADDLRAIAFYRLPPATRAGRDARGEDLPEWRRVRSARPRFLGHRQPQAPGELGYCDVRDASVRETHARLAREYAIAGFCYVFRSGEPAGELDPTLAAILSSGRPDFPFCVCWETTSAYAGAAFDPYDNGRERRFSRDECVAVMRSLIEAFRDRRYIRIDGRPLLIVSSPDPIPEVTGVAAQWRDECMRAGVGDPYVACYGGALGGDPAQLGFDALVECPPLGGFPRSRTDEVVAVGPGSPGNLKCYRSYIGQLLVTQRSNHRLFRTVMPGWDGTPRGAEYEPIFVNGNPETFGYWVERAVDQTRLRHRGDERLLFVRAWNEWEASCHLEPDARNGRRYLEALRAGLCRTSPPIPTRPPWSEVAAWAAPGGGIEATRIVRSPAPARAGRREYLVSVVMPAYNHARFVLKALDSVVAQTHPDLEIIVIDDGSKDATGRLLDEYAHRCLRELTVVHQANAGAHEAINHGLALARGDTIAIMNSDDLYAPARLERLLAAMDAREAALAFSDTRFIDDGGDPVDPDDPYVKQLHRVIEESRKLPDLLYALVYSNIAISTGNFVVRRRLLEKLGGFCAMRVCHDWEFLLAASYETPLVFVDEPLYQYRLHDTNTFSGSRVLASVELEQVLSRFFARLAEHPLAADPARLDAFVAHVRRIGMGGYVDKIGRRD